MKICISQKPILMDLSNDIESLYLELKYVIHYKKVRKGIYNGFTEQGLKTHSLVSLMAILVDACRHDVLACFWSTYNTSCCKLRGPIFRSLSHKFKFRKRF